MNPLVDRVAESVYAARAGGRGPKWAQLVECKKDGYREKVEEVLLAAMNAGLVIREISAEKVAEVAKVLVVRE